MIKLRFETQCIECGKHLGRGINAYYWPSDKEVLCLSCGHEDYQSFLSSVADENIYNGVGNPYCG